MRSGGHEMYCEEVMCERSMREERERERETLKGNSSNYFNKG